MKWLDKLETRFPNWGIEGLMRYVTFLMLTVFVLNKSQIVTYDQLYLNSFLVKSGQVWRLITFLFIPQSNNILFLFFELMILIMCADGLESEWGTFKLTAYYAFGALANILLSFLFPMAVLDSNYLYLTFFLGFATIFPTYEILIFFILPVQVKWLALLSGVFLVYSFAVGSILAKVAVLLSVGNYILFFYQEAFDTMKRNYRQKKRQKQYAEAFTPETKVRNRCTVCDRTEVSNPELEFRYCTCKVCGSDGKSFCMEHLKEHKSKTAQV